MEAFRDRTWKDILGMLLRLPLPARSLKFLPPDFVLRDPILSSLHTAREKGDFCAMLYFAINDQGAPRASFDPSQMKRLRRAFVSALTASFPLHDILGVKRFFGDGYGVFLRSSQPFGIEQLSEVTAAIRVRMEGLLIRESGSPRAVPVKLISSCCTIEKYPLSTDEAVRTAVQCSQALAAGKLPLNYARYRQEMIGILNEEAISVLTQPIMCLESGDVLGWEVLTRGPVHSPYHMPTELFDFAQQAGLLIPMEWLVIRKAFQEISRKGICEQVFINITPVTLSQPQLLDKMLEWMQEYRHVKPEQIVLEITERHSIEDFTFMSQILARYREYGFRFAIDDAGAGYASLQTISELTPDIIKIDKSVIRDIDQTQIKQSMLQALLQMAESIKCKVIAEGIEREEEADILCRNRVHMGQGYLFSRPQPVHFEYGAHFVGVKEKIIQLREASCA
ncbi:EAL domain-containing protein [Gorillibacterium timonense]|uniref:EAL domain-containing protein n=1 Tax=Gorillibacterium timonense TaxID=1689269 RepID=UPI00071CD860|nr:EAL domain-containing protein [Gorillibacterium timonense]